MLKVKKDSRNTGVATGPIGDAVSQEMTRRSNLLHGALGHMEAAITLLLSCKQEGCDVALTLNPPGLASDKVSGYMRCASLHRDAPDTVSNYDISVAPNGAIHLVFPQAEDCELDEQDEWQEEFTGDRLASAIRDSELRKALKSAPGAESFSI